MSVLKATGIANAITALEQSMGRLVDRGVVAGPGLGRAAGWLLQRDQA